MIANKKNSLIIRQYRGNEWIIKVSLCQSGFCYVLLRCVIFCLFQVWILQKEKGDRGTVRAFLDTWLRQHWLIFAFISVSNWLISPLPVKSKTSHKKATMWETNLFATYSASLIINGDFHEILIRANRKDGWDRGREGERENERVRESVIRVPTVSIYSPGCIQAQPLFWPFSRSSFFSWPRTPFRVILDGSNHPPPIHTYIHTHAHARKHTLTHTPGATQTPIQSHAHNLVVLYLPCK